MSPTVVAMVLTWNDVEMTRRCARSVLANRYEPLRLLIVDNGSTPPVAPTLAADFHEAEILHLEVNQGFAGGCNRGIERALALGADYVFLLNNDTVVQEEAIGALVAALESDDRAGIASAVILYPGEERRIQSFDGYVDRDRARITRPTNGELLGDAHRKVVASDFVPACAIMMRPRALEEVGLFDESLFVNWDDYDFCARMRDGGWKLLVSGRAEVEHWHGQTTGTVSPYITYFATRNRLVCLFRYGRPWRILLNLPHLLRSFHRQIQGYGYSNARCHAALAKGVLHFLLGVKGDAYRGSRANRAKRSPG